MGTLYALLKHFYPSIVSIGTKKAVIQAWLKYERKKNLDAFGLISWPSLLIVRFVITNSPI